MLGGSTARQIGEGERANLPSDTNGEEFSSYTSRRLHGIFGERKRAYKWGLIGESLVTLVSAQNSEIHCTGPSIGRNNLLDPSAVDNSSRVKNSRTTANNSAI